jgi:hypothetical protein
MGRERPQRQDKLELDSRLLREFENLVRLAVSALTIHLFQDAKELAPVEENVGNQSHDGVPRVPRGVSRLQNALNEKLHPEVELEAGTDTP